MWDSEFPFSYCVCEYILALAFLCVCRNQWAAASEGTEKKNELHQQIWQWRSASLSVCSKHKTIKAEAVAKEMHMELFLFPISPLRPPFSSHLQLFLFVRTQTHTRTHSCFCRCNSSEASSVELESSKTLGLSKRHSYQKTRGHTGEGEGRT